jgi:hypothetical protein
LTCLFLMSTKKYKKIKLHSFKILQEGWRIVAWISCYNMRVGRKISHILKEITCALEKGFTNIKIGEKMGAIPKT